MNHKLIVMIIISAILMGAYFLYFNNKANDVSPIHHGTVMPLINKAPTYPSTQTIKIATNVNTDTVNPLDSVDSAASHAEKTPYESNWCTESDLSEEDSQYAQTQTAEWNESRGYIFLREEGDDVSSNKYSHLLDTYKAMTLEHLLELAMQDDEWAMSAALQSTDLRVTPQIKDKLANRLIILNKSPFGLTRLFSGKVFDIEREFKKTKQITPKLKQDMKDAMKYLSYSVSRYDVTVLNVYGVATDQIEGFKTVLNPRNVLTDEDFEEVKQSVHQFVKQIDEQREKENLPPINQIDIPKIAHHEFESSLAHLYFMYGDIFNDIEPANLETGPQIKPSACVKRYVAALKG